MSKIPWLFQYFVKISPTFPVCSNSLIFPWLEIALSYFPGFLVDVGAMNFQLNKHRPSALIFKQSHYTSQQIHAGWFCNLFHFPWLCFMLHSHWAIAIAKNGYQCLLWSYSYQTMVNVKGKVKPFFAIANTQCEQTFNNIHTIWVICICMWPCKTIMALVRHEIRAYWPLGIAFMIEIATSLFLWCWPSLNTNSTIEDNGVNFSDVAIASVIVQWERSFITWQLCGY